MSAIFRSKLFESKSGYFADSIGIGIKKPSESLHISGGNLKIDDGGAIFSNRPVVSGISVLLSGDIDASSFYPNNNPSGFITGIDTSNFYTRNNPSGFITGIQDLVYTTGNQTVSGIKTFVDNFSIRSQSDIATFCVASGRIGINNNNPIANLDVSGSVSFTEKPTVNGVQIMLSGDFNSNLENLYTEIYNTQNNSIMYALALG